MNLAGHKISEVMQRTPDYVSDDQLASFWLTGDYEGGISWVGRFDGTSPWEKHPGDEYLHVLEGTVRITLLTEPEPTEIVLEAGMVFVVPKNTWHRQQSDGTVVEIGATPGESELSDAEDPRLS